MCHVDDRHRNGRGVRIGGDVANECDIDLERVNLETLQVGQV